MKMTDTLTPEQRETVEAWRVKSLQFCDGHYLVPVAEVLSILDSLSQPKKYTEEELDAIATQNLCELFNLTSQEIEETKQHTADAYTLGFIDGARFLGAIKEKEG